MKSSRLGKSFSKTGYSRKSTCCCKANTFDIRFEDCRDKGDGNLHFYYDIFLISDMEKSFHSFFFLHILSKLKDF